MARQFWQDSLEKQFFPIALKNPGPARRGFDFVGM
jgi:hypothetical protein